MLCSCSDTWDDHYQPQEAGEGDVTLLQLIEQNPNLSDFAKLLHATHLYNNLHSTPVTYAKLLGSDQSLTVWAPLNGTFNVDSLLQLCETAKGDSTVGQHFVGNHIAHNLYNMNEQTKSIVKMLNDKVLPLSETALSGVPVSEGKKNMPATNGLLNVLDKEVLYTYNVYEGLTSLPEFSHLGLFLKSFELNELDEDQSVVAGIEDGQKVYSDSVMRQENMLFRTFDYINSEDSSFVMLAPSAEMWTPVFNEAKRYFNFGSAAKADSLQNYWTNVSLMQDLIYNQNVQRSLADSVIMTSYKAAEYPYHVYYKPTAFGGLLDASKFSGELACSNGKIQYLKFWPFDKSLYFHPITIQGEREANMIESKDCSVNYRTIMADSVSGNGYLDIVPKTSTSNWTATFEVANTLSGTYDLYAVVLPKTVYNVYSRDTKPNKFTAVVNYVDENGAKKKTEFMTEVSNNPRQVDSVLIGRVNLPVTSYRQSESIVSVQLKCSITNRQTTYSREMYLDCLYLKPVDEKSENN